jgi:sugar phosphate isomerase/epimerase
MPSTRRSFLRETAAAAAAASLPRGIRAGEPVGQNPASPREPIARRGPPLVKVACCAYSLRQYLGAKPPSMTMEDFLGWAAEVGCDGVELTSYYFPPDCDTAYMNRMKRQSFLLGLDISGTAVGNSFCVPSGPEREKQIAGTKTWIDNARELGAPCIRVFAGSAPPGVSDDQARRWVVECLEECCAHAADRGVMVALENHGGVTADAAGTLAIVRAVASPWFGANLDTGNFHSEDPYAEIAQVAPYAITTHVKASVSARGKPREPADLARIGKILREAGYRGYLSLEYEEGGEPKAASAAIIRMLKEIAAPRAP